jgi:hypothetical protein
VKNYEGTNVGEMQEERREREREGKGERKGERREGFVFEQGTQSEPARPNFSGKVGGRAVGLFLPVCDTL